MSDQELENGCMFSNSGDNSRRSSNDGIDKRNDIGEAVDSCEVKQNGALYSQDLEVKCRKLGLSLAENGLIGNGSHEPDFGEDFDGDEPPNENSRSEMNQVHGLRDNLRDAETLAENSSNGEQNQAKEKWERDSGMELTSTDSSLQQIMAAASNAMGAARSSNFLELASTLHLAALGSLKTDMAETTTMLEDVRQERDSLQALLDQSAHERKEIIRDYEERLSSQAQQSEEHITELQSVIAELSKKANQNSANKIDELEEVEIESQTSEHGSQSDSDSLGSSDPEDDEMDEEISKVVDDFGFAIEREKPTNRDTRKGKRGRREDEQQDRGREGAQELEEARRQGEAQEEFCKTNGEDADAEKEKLRRKCSELQVRCLEFEKKSQILERQLQQASLREYVSRKRSSGSASSADELQAVTCERDEVKTRLRDAEEALDQARGEAAGFKNERDRLRKRLIEMQEQLKSLHQRSVLFEHRVRSQSLESGAKSPRVMRASQPGPSAWEQRGHYRSRAPSGPASSASSDISSRDGAMTSPRISRRSSTDNLNTTGASSRSALSNSGSLRRPSVGNLVGPPLSPAESAQSVRHPPGSAPAGQLLVRPAMTSDYGSVQGSTAEITVLAKAVDEGLERGFSGENCIRALSQLPEFSSGKMPAGLVRALEGCRSAKEVYTSLFNFCDEQANAELKQYELDLERLKSRFDHLQAQNNVISRSLDESRENSERLSALMGRYESNHTAFQLALNSCDRSVEAYTVLLQLAELEQASLVLKFQAAGSRLSHQSSIKGSPSRSNCSDFGHREMERNSLDLETILRRKNLVENTACMLLQKLDRRFEQQGIEVPQRQSSSSHSRSSSFSSTNEVEFTRGDEARLRAYVERLKSERLTIGMTIQKLDSIAGIPEPKRAKEESIDPRLDLENAVLMQELMALKEEKAELKAKNYLIEKEKKALELRMTSRDAQEQAYLVHIDHLKSEMQDEIKRRRKIQRENGVASSKSDDRSGTSSSSPSITLAELRTTDEDIPSDLYEAAKREKKLKARIQELMETLETLSKNSEVRHQQTAEYVADLKKANGALVAAYEKAKKKHGARLRKLEQQMIALVERHDKQVRTLKERIALLEEDNRVLPVKQNETAL